MAEPRFAFAGECSSQSAALPILTQRGTSAGVALRPRARRGRRELVDRLPRELRQPREDAAFRLALEVTTAGHRAIVFTDRLVQNDAGPVARRELGLSDVGDGAGFRAADPDAIADDEAVGVLGEDDAVV